MAILRGSRRRLAVALVAALALVWVPMTVTVPVQADVDCTATLHISDPATQDVVLLGSGSRFSVSGEVRDLCPGDGRFEETEFIQRVLGNVVLNNGATSEGIEWNTHYDYGGFWGSVANFDAIDGAKQIAALGPASVNVWASDGNSWIFDSDSFYVRRAQGFPRYNAGPEPVRKGSPVKVSGYLTRLVYYASGEPKYIPYAGKRVDMYFARAGFGGGYVASTTTTSTGHFAKSFTSTYDGCWYAQSPRAGYYEASRERADCVDVVP
jgi:hypothetical protein